MKKLPRIYVKNYQLYIAVELLIIVGLSFLVRLTPLVKILWVNQLTWIIHENEFSLLLITFLLIAIHLVEMKIHQDRIEDEEKNVN